MNDKKMEDYIDKVINLSIITKLKDLKLINEKQYYILKEEINKFYDYSSLKK